MPLCAVCRSVLLRRLRLTHFNAFQWWEKRPEIAPFVGDPGPNLAHGSLGPPSSTTLDGLSIGSAVYVELTVVSNRQTHTDHATTVARDRIAFLTDNAYSRPIQEISNQNRWQSPGGQTDDYYLRFTMIRQVAALSRIRTITQYPASYVNWREPNFTPQPFTNLSLGQF